MNFDSDSWNSYDYTNHTGMCCGVYNVTLGLRVQILAVIDPPYDVLLAADVVYIEETFPVLLQSIEALTDTETTIYTDVLQVSL